LAFVSDSNMTGRIPKLITVSLCLAGLSFTQTVGSTPNGYLLPNGWRLTPLGQIIEMGDLILNMTATPDGKAIVAMHSGFTQNGLVVIDVRSGEVLRRIPVATAWLGMAWNPAGTILYVSGGGCCRDIDKGISPAPIYAFRYENERLQEWPEGMLRDNRGPDETYWSGVAHDPKRNILFAADRNANQIVAFETDSKKVVARMPTESNPYELVIAPDGKTLYASNISSDSVGVYDAQTFQLRQVLATGDNPGAMALSPDGRLYVSCSNDNAITVLDTKTGDTLETIATSLYPGDPEGSTPTALSLDAATSHLYVANADNNDVAVIDVSSPGHSRVLGFLPTGWYPSAVTLSRSGSTLFVGNSKGTHSSATPNGPGAPKDLQKRHSTSASSTSGSVHTLTPGAVTVVDIKKALRDIRKNTVRVMANSPYKPHQMVEAERKATQPTVVPPTVGAGSPIKHVIYIIKENRTYDQVLGDLPQGNGDPQLTLFGRKITPNEHKLAEDFVLLDNFYVDGEVSTDGHQWSTAAYATDFAEKSWPPSYARRASEEVGDDGFANIPKSGYIWDQVLRKGLTLRMYGDDCCFLGRSQDRIRKYFSTRYGSWKARDYENAKTFIEDFEQFEKNYDSPKADQRLPNFIVMMLPEDHTYGTTPGRPTPLACVASNDYGLGLIVERVSHSRYWKETAIFVVEDDAQDGPDHVDARRSTAYVISPYVRRKSVNHTMYTTSSILRTMELLLGLRPMSQYDAAATPMYDIFGNEADLQGFSHLEPLVDIEERNTATAYGAADSAAMDFSEVDRIPMHRLNEIIWKSIRGSASIFPAPRTGFIGF
jgi:YVTN family beta-propeller protein